MTSTALLDAQQQCLIATQMRLVNQTQNAIAGLVDKLTDRLVIKVIDA